MSRSASRSNVSSPAAQHVPPVPPVDPLHGVDIGSVLAVALDDRWLVFSAAVTQSRHAISKKQIHDLRVATRRLLANLNIVESLLSGKSLPKLHRRLKRHLRPFGLLRDLQLQRSTLRELVVSYPSLRPYANELALREQTLVKRARRELREIELERAQQEIDQFREQLIAMLSDPAMGRAAVAVVMGSLAKAYLQASALKNAAMSGRTPSIHRFRISFKRFRYMVEALQPLLPGVPVTMFPAMNAYQTRMGAIQDQEVLMESLFDWSQRHKRMVAAVLAPCRTALERTHKELVASFLASAIEFEGFWQALQSRSTEGGR